MYDLIFVTKPIQYVNARNAVETIFQRDRKYILVIVDHFEGALNFAKNIILNDSIWFDVNLVKSRVEALILTRKYKVINIFTNSDISKDPFLFKFFHPFATLILYEEGWGNYIRDILFDRGPSKRLIYTLLGLNRQYGASRFTKKIFLYRPSICDVNIEGKVESFAYSFSEYIKKEAGLLRNIFRQAEEDFDSDKVITFILPSKKWNKSFDYLDYHFFDSIYLKPHPHTMDYNSDLVKKYNVTVLDNSYFIELIVAQTRSKITIYHDHSMVGVYARFNNVTIHNLGSKENKVLSDFFDKVEKDDLNN